MDPMSDTHGLVRKVQEATTRRHQAGERRTRLAGRNRLRPDLLALEERRMLSMVITVTSTADSGPNTLREAIGVANAATQPVEIKFDLPGAATITLTSAELELTNTAEPIAIEGPGADELTVDGNSAFRVFEIDNGVMASISGLSVSDGFTSGYGAGLFNQGDLTLTGVTCSHNATLPYATFSPTGGGLVNFGMATVVDSAFADNTGGQGGGVINGGPRTEPDGTVTLEGCSFIDNTSITFGGGMENFGSATLDGCSFVGNTSPDDGAGFDADSDGHVLSSVLSNCSFIDNTSGFFGGGLAVDGGGSGPLQVVDCIFRDNQAPDGGGLWLLGGLSVGGGPIPATISGCVIEGNRAIMPIHYEGGIGGAGGGLSVTGIATTVTDCIISNNYTNGQSGGVVASGAPFTMTGVTISGNSATSEGGGLILTGPSTLTDCTISGNSAGQGGGLWLFGEANVALVACTISGNSATTPGGGGGLYSYPYYGTEPSVTLTDTIVAGNTASDGASDFAPDFLGAVTGSYNLIGTGAPGGLTAANHNILDATDPGLAPLGDYGGPTETMALQPDSPAIGAGTAVSGVTTDQRGFSLDQPVDIGAFQLQAGPLVVDTAIDGLGSGLGQLSLRQAVNLADVLTGGVTITFDKSAFSGPPVIDLSAGQLELSNPTGPIKILGPGFDKLAISGAGASRVFQVDGGTSASLSGLTITGGATAGDGGGVLDLGTVNLSGDAIVGNSAADGGGFANSGTAVILGSTIDGNAASANGGGIFNTGSLALSLSDLSANVTAKNGGGLYNTGTAALVFCTVDDNSAIAGGGIYADPSGSPVVLIGTQVKRNKGGNIFGRVINLF
jgi:hypothetical protein